MHVVPGFVVESFSPFVLHVGVFSVPFGLEPLHFPLPSSQCIPKEPRVLHVGVIVGLSVGHLLINGHCKVDYCGTTIQHWG